MFCQNSFVHKKLVEINIRIWSVRADGLITNLVAFQKLGCSSSEMQTYFLHLSNNFPVYIIFYPCHMLILARNVFADKKILTSNFGKICWLYFDWLRDLQKHMGFKFASKISGTHLNYTNKIVNIPIAAQTLSSSTANELNFLMQCNDKNFAGAEATIEYIRVVDRIFDVCNSRTPPPFGKGFKSPLMWKNKNY